MADELHPYGTIFSYSAADSDASYTALANLINVTPPNVEVGDMETTNLESTGAAREHLPGWIEAGEVTLGLRFKKAEFNTLYGLLRAMRYFTIEFPQLAAEATAGSTWKFRGFIRRIGNPTISVDGDEAIQTDVTIKISGKPTFTQGS